MPAFRARDLRPRSNRRRKTLRFLREISSGAVIFKRVGSKSFVCLISRRKNQRPVWCLPKGHVERGESLSKAALREAKEETGLSSSICAPLGSIRYLFIDRKRKARIFKTVHFFLTRYLRGKLKDHDEEVEEAKWFSISRAIQNAEYPGERTVLRKAARTLKGS